MKQKLLMSLSAAVALGVIYFFAIPSYRQGEPSIAGRRAPDFALEVDGHPAHLSDYRGKVVLLDFWASWCPPCVEETQALNALQQRIASQGGVILGISQDEDPAAYQTFLAEQHVTFATYRDPTKKVQTSYGTTIIPEAYLISRDGKIARKIVGGQDWGSPELTSTIDTLLHAN